MIKSAKVPVGVDLLIGSAEAIPAAAETAGFLVHGLCAAPYRRHITAALREFMRVLKPGGRICLLEITRPEGRVPHAVLKAYMRGVVPFLAGISRREFGFSQIDALLLGHDRCLRRAGRNS